MLDEKLPGVRPQQRQGFGVLIKGDDSIIA
jgi:hypothetical protein